jgi:tetratricopeptide (TPR) repeat protein
MKLQMAVILLLLVFGCEDEQKGSKFVQLPPEEAFYKARQDSKLVLIDFFSKTCNPCRALLKDVFNNSRMSVFINAHFISVKITSEWEDYQQIRDKYNVTGLPTVIFFDTDGTEIDRNCGYDGRKEDYFQTIQNYVQGKNTLKNLLDAYHKDSLNVSINYELGMKHVNRWEFPQSVPYFDKVLRLDPDDESGYGEQSRLNIAIDDARRQETSSPLVSFVSEAKNIEFLGIAYDHILSRYESAGNSVQYLTACEEVMNKFPHKDIAYWRLLNFYHAKKDTVQYLKILERAVTYMPNDAGYLNRYAWVIYETRQKEKYPYAIQMAEKALKMNPDAAYIWDTLGWLYFAAGIRDNAIDAMKKAITLDPQKKDYRKNLKIFETES